MVLLLGIVLTAVINMEDIYIKKGTQANKVTKNDCLEAIDYFFVEGFMEDMKSDQQHYLKFLLNKVANEYKIKLDWGSND